MTVNGSALNVVEMSSSDNSGRFGTLGKNETDLDEALDMTGFGKYHVFLVIACGSCLAAMITESLGVSFILTAAQCEFSLTTTEKGYIAGVTFFGMIISAQIWIYAANAMGSKKVLVTSYIGAWVFSFSSGFAPTYSMFLASRFLTGLFLSGISINAYDYLCDFVPAKKRSKFIIRSCGFIGLGLISIPVTAWTTIPKDTRLDTGFVVITSWRVYMMILGIATLINGIFFSLQPNTPRFLMSIGKTSEALEVLRKVYAYNSNKTPMEYPVVNLKDEMVSSIDESRDANVPSITKERSEVAAGGIFTATCHRTRELFMLPKCWKIWLFCALNFGIYASFGGIYLWLPTILNLMIDSVANETSSTICGHLSRNESVIPNPYTNECEDTLVQSQVYYPSVLVLGFVFVILVVIIEPLTRAIGKRNVLVGIQILNGFIGIGTYFVTNAIWTAILVSGYALLAGACIGVLIATIVDLYPQNLRTMAIALVSVCGWLGSGVAGLTMGILTEANCHITCIGMGILSLQCGLVSIFIPTAEDKILESDGSKSSVKQKGKSKSIFGTVKYRL